MNVLGYEAMLAGPMSGDTSSPTVRGWDWTVDGASVRELWAGPEHPFLTEAVPLEDRLESLDRLAGRTTEPPSFDLRFDRSLLDRLLGRQGTPWAYSGPAFEDGRVCLAVCPCGDLDCGALTAAVVVEGSTVRWEAIGWQVTYEAFDTSEQGVFTAEFDRVPYLEVVDAVRAEIASPS